MAFYYAMSDIHGAFGSFERALCQIDLEQPGNKLFLLGDYIDYGAESGQVLRRVYQLQQEYGAERVVALKGNHEAALLEWLDAYAGEKAQDGLPDWSGWLEEECGTGFRTLRTLLPEAALEQWRQAAAGSSEEARNREAARLVLAENGACIRWLRGLPWYYETETQIFVHAGIDEEAGDWWPWGTPDYVFAGKFPAETGSFYKDIVAGHIGTAALAGDPDYHRVFWDGQSHYYIDGSTAESGCLPILKYDTESGRYTELLDGAEAELQKNAGR